MLFYSWISIYIFISLVFRKTRMVITPSYFPNYNDTLSLQQEIGR